MHKPAHVFAAVRFRAYALGVLLVVANNFWLMASATWASGYPTTVSLFHHVIFILFVVIGMSALGRALPGYRRALLNRAEQVVLYTMLCVASGIGGLDLMQVLGTFTNGLRHLATPENDWDALFFRYVPDWLVVGDVGSIKALADGGSSLYTWPHVRALLPSALVWSGFILVLSVVMLCLTLLVREQWTETEKLSYPIIQLPLHMTTRSSALFTNRAMWLGFALAGMANLLNGLNFLYPAVPGVGGKLYDLAPLAPNPPWNAIGWTPLSLWPYAVGLAFFMPLDMSFSAWFLYLFWKLEMIAGRAIGLQRLPNFPYIEAQAAGAYAGLCVLALWTTRRHLRAVLRGDPRIDYRTPRVALIGGAAGVAALLWFCMALKMTPWVAALFTLGYFVLSLGITRMRAELGSPVHDLHRAGPHLMIVDVFGTRALSTADMTALSFHQGYNRAYRGHPMPHQLEGFKLGEQSRTRPRALVLAVLLASALAPLVSFWALAHYSFRHGIPNVGKVPESFGRLAGWIAAQTAPSAGSSLAVAYGAAITLLLAALRARYVWFPLHPAGYAVTSGWSINLFWCSIFVSWAAKLAILRFGGLPLLRRAQPFFLGVILGDFVVGSLWMLRGAVLEAPTYRFLF
ncbi:hypothetical protein CMK11_17350 [Candidatus Poribacteria bacterium]|nr:hypothetical protein [Candidatus Poribacteria bacterium]